MGDRFHDAAYELICENSWGWPEGVGEEELTPDQQGHVDVLAAALRRQHDAGMMAATAPGGHYYFGCWDRAGHFLFDPRGEKVDGRAIGLDPASLDGNFCPTSTYPGHCKLMTLYGRTFLGFWDGTVDGRGGSNSIFILAGVHDFEAAVKLAGAAFPWFWERYKGWKFLRFR